MRSAASDGQLALVTIAATASAAGTRLGSSALREAGTEIAAAATMNKLKRRALFMLMNGKPMQSSSHDRNLMSTVRPLIFDRGQPAAINRFFNLAGFANFLKEENGCVV